MLTAVVENTNLYSVQKDGKSAETHNPFWKAVQPKAATDEKMAVKSVDARKKARKEPSQEIKMDPVGQWPVKTDISGRFALCTTG